MWKTLTLTTADNIKRLSFRGRGSIFADGTFGGGVVQIHAVAYHNGDVNAQATVSTGFIDSAIDGSLVKSVDSPAGDYELNLAGSTGATVTIYYNDQADLTVEV